MSEDPRPPLRCSFCNKSQRDVRKLIAGPTVYICDECVEVCNDILAEDGIVAGVGAGAALRAVKLAEEYLGAARALVRASEWNSAALEIRNVAIAALRGLLHLSGDRDVANWSETKVTVMALDSSAEVARLLQVDDTAHVILRVTIRGAHFTMQEVMTAANVAETLIAMVRTQAEAVPPRTR